MSFGQFINFFPCFYICSHLTPVLNRHSSQIIHLNLCLPILLTAIGLQSLNLFIILSLFILTICPNPSYSLCSYLSDGIYIFLKQKYFLISSYSPSLILIFIGPSIFLITFFSNSLSLCSFMCFISHVSLPYVTTGLSRLYKCGF
jgi:hypothetical protein